MDALDHSERSGDLGEGPSSFDRLSSARPLEGLLKIATSDLYRHSPFRNLGVALDATARELARHVEAIKLEIDLGTSGLGQHRAFAPDRSLDTDIIRDCLQLLRDPIPRFIYEFFWFWPSDWMPSGRDEALRFLGKGQPNEALNLWLQRERTGDVAAAHNIAIFFHIKATEPNVEENPSHAWREAYRRWRHLVDQEEYWEFLSLRLRAVDDPQLTLAVLRNFRATLPIALAKVALEMALAACNQNDLEAATALIEISKEGPGDPADWQKALELVAFPIRGRIDHAVDRACEAFKSNKRNGVSAVNSLAEAALYQVRVLELFYGPTSEEFLHTSDSIVTTCINAGVAYQKETGDDNGFLEALKAGEAFKASKEVAERLASNKAIAEGNIAYTNFVQPIENAVESVQNQGGAAKGKLSALRSLVSNSLPSIESEASREIYQRVCAIVVVALRDVSISAFNKEDDFDTAEAAINCALPLASSEPTAEAQLQKDLAHIKNARPSPWRFLTGPIIFSLKHPFLALFALAVVISIFSNLNSSTPARSPTTSQPTPSGNYTPPQSSATPPNTGTGNNYSIPSNMTAQFRAKKQKLDQLETQIITSKTYLDALERTLNQYDQNAVDTFNRQVNAHNLLITQHQQLVNEYNSDLQIYGRRR